MVPRKSERLGLFTRAGYWCRLFFSIMSEIPPMLLYIHSTLTYATHHMRSLGSLHSTNIICMTDSDLMAFLFLVMTLAFRGCFSV
jgi:hypothetical protein